MARPKSIPIRQHLRKLFPTKLLNALARETGATRRRRKVDPATLFWTVVLGIGTGRSRSLAGMRRAYERASGRQIEESSFFNRFNAGFAKMLRLAFAHALAVTAGTERALQGALGVFEDVLLTDSTVVRLHELLERSFPACRTNHTKAALKLHTVMSVRTAGCRSVKITSERQHDGPVLRAGGWVKDRLLIFDLGYFRYQLFACIDRCGGFFLTRLKGHCNPVIVASNRTHRGRARHVVGKRLQDVIAGLHRELLDVVVEVRFSRRSYGGKTHRDTQLLRVVGVRDERTGAHHLYVTNVPVDKLAAEDVRAVYAARWQIELLFKEWKQHYRLEQIPSRKRHVVEALIFAALLAAVISGALLAAFRAKLKSLANRLPQQRWAALLAASAGDLLLVVVLAPRHTKDLVRRLTDLLMHEAIDPNRARLSLINAVEMRQHQYARRAA
jgi:putative transposase